LGRHCALIEISGNAVFAVPTDELPPERAGNRAATFRPSGGVFPTLKNSPRKTVRVKMSEWVLHCPVNHRHIRRRQPTREAALKDACSQLFQGHAVNRIVGPNETINAKRIMDWCAKHRPQSP